MNDVLYTAIREAMAQLETVPAGKNTAVDLAYNTLHRAYWSECPAPADKPQLRPVP